jgi:hydrogenase maturation protein HypF
MNEWIRVRGQVQGVGFRPAVARLAQQLGLHGWVKNDAEGVLIALGGTPQQRERFVAQLLADLPPLARVHELSRTAAGPAPALPARGFAILGSSVAEGAAPTASVVPDAALCAACAAEVLDPSSRRHRYPFTNCTHCGPRYSIALGLPWDRARTTQAGFALCEDCRAEYRDIADRRYHAEPIACPSCGPSVQLTRTDGRPFTLAGLDPNACDAVAAVSGLLLRGDIVALKGLGGYQLLVDATNEEAVQRLRQRKQRPHKPFALMARDLEMLRRYCAVSKAERSALESPAAPIVILRALASVQAPALASALSDLPLTAAHSHGFMLPSTPLHLLALANMPRPVVCTSGNRSAEPQVIDDAAVFAELDEIADWIVSHDRPIRNRVDDSVVRVFGGRMRVLRRARGFAPAPLALPPGFERVAEHERVLAAGADLKAALCLSRQNDLVLCQHLGDLDDLETYAQYGEQSEQLAALFEHQPTRFATDNHPEARAAEHARARAHALGLPCESVPHHHAHLAACWGDNNVPLTAAASLGLVLDGVGASDDAHALWGGEVLAGGYTDVERVASLEPIALLGGDRAAREPWRCLYAQLRATSTWGDIRASFGAVSSVQRLQHKPTDLLDRMLETGIGAPLASSCGRLFDAVAAALELCFEQQTYEAQAAQALEALAAGPALARAGAERMRGEHYALPISRSPRRPLQLASSRLVHAVLADLARGVAKDLIAARFHVALAAGLAQLCAEVASAREHSGRPVQRQVALSGGCLQNAVLHERLTLELEALGFKVLAHAEVPANDGGIALGQALVTLARCARERGLER